MAEGSVRNIHGNMMRAVLVRQFGGVENMKLVNVPVPAIGDNEVLIKVRVSGINPVDTYIREGAFVETPDLPYVPGIDGAGVVEEVGKLVTLFKVLVKVYASGVNPVDTYVRSGQYSNLPPLPYVPGKDAAGVVHSVGSQVTKFQPGDRVFSSFTAQMGTLAEYSSVPETSVHPLDKKLTFEQGAAIGIPYFTAYRALFLKAGAKNGERLLIHGASGAVGLAAVQIAKAHGLHVVGTAGTQEGLDLVKSLGADAVFNHRDKKYLSKLEKEEKFDIVLEMLANVNLGKDLSLMRSRGRTIVIGSRGDVTISPRLLMVSESSVIGCALLTSTPEEWKEQISGILEGIKSGWVKPVVDRVYRLEEAGKAHEDIINSKGAKGNLVVMVQE